MKKRLLLIGISLVILCAGCKKDVPEVEEEKIVLDAPSNVKVTGIKDNQEKVKITWDKVDGADFYYVMYRNNTISKKKPKMVKVENTEYIYTIDVSGIKNTIDFYEHFFTVVAASGQNVSPESEKERYIYIPKGTLGNPIAGATDIVYPKKFSDLKSDITIEDDFDLFNMIKITIPFKQELGDKYDICLLVSKTNNIQDVENIHVIFSSSLSDYVYCSGIPCEPYYLWIQFRSEKKGFTELEPLEITLESVGGHKSLPAPKITGFEKQGDDYMLEWKFTGSSCYHIFYNTSNDPSTAQYYRSFNYQANSAVISKPAKNTWFWVVSSDTFYDSSSISEFGEPVVVK